MPFLCRMEEEHFQAPNTNSLLALGLVDGNDEFRSDLINQS